VATCRPPGRVPDLPNLTPLARRHRDEVYNQPGDWDINTFSDEDAFGDHIKIKNTHCLHISFLNIGGFPTTKGKIKEDYIKIGSSFFCEKCCWADAPTPSFKEGGGLVLYTFLQVTNHT
jgi:hypothetical protein